MTHDELLEKIDWIGETKNAESGTATPLGVAVLASLNALRAVVELHKPYDIRTGTMLGDVSMLPSAYCCKHCSAFYPCPTIQAIEKELK